ncbi:uncharacterized protein LOC106883040 isoform X2 [Octopus bimaculoides]|uniref:uncharacterized protein LOC106883040 isoform X2 n=1 Tax=Octopus bimaculoides TaxID=37653 RepID=UPI00071D6F0B|nr:uncharacterized protein LOC106883040 isoform X2 [Octopus bimaculoides]|eukprot:XP_014789391.1 PREDICTED: uncharacterized protein LOC106883040 isoform X2 [Octopus bimaculoides]
MFSENSPEWYSSIDEKPFSNRIEYDDTEAKRNQIQSFEKDINQMESMISSMEAMSKNIRAHLFEMQPATGEGLTTRLKPYDGPGSHPSSVTSPDFNDADNTYSEVSCMSSSEDANYNDYKVLQTEPWKEVKRRPLPPPRVQLTIQPDPDKESYQTPVLFKSQVETYQEEPTTDTTLLPASDDGLQQTHHQEEMAIHSTNNNLPSPVLHQQTIKLEDLVSQAAKLLEDGATKPNIDTDALETDENVKESVTGVNARQQDAGQNTAKMNIDGTKRQQNASRKKSGLFVSGNKEEEDDDDDEEEEEEEEVEDEEEVEEQYGDQGTARVRRGQHVSWYMSKRDRKECVTKPHGWSVQRQQGLLWPSEKPYDVYDKKKRKKDVSENGNEQDVFRSSRQQRRAIKREQYSILGGGKQQGDVRKKNQPNDKYPNIVWQHNNSDMDATDQIFNTFSFPSHDDTLPVDWGYSDDPDEEILFRKRDQLYNNVYSPNSFANKRISYGKERHNEKTFVRGGCNEVHKQNSEMSLRRHIKSRSTNDISKIYDGSNNCQFPGMSMKGGHTLNSQVFSDSDEYQETDWLGEKDRRRTLSLTRHTPKNKSRGVHFNDTVYMIDDMYDKIPLRHQKDRHHCHHNDHRHADPYESVYSSSYINPSHIRSCSKGFYNNPQHFYADNYEAAEPHYDYSPWIRRPPQPAKHWSFVSLNTTPVLKARQSQNAHASKKVGNPILKKTPQKGAESSNSGSKVVDRSSPSLSKKTSETGLILQSGYSPDSGYLSDTPKMLGCTNKTLPPYTNVKNISEAKKDISNNSPTLKMVCCVMSMPVKDSNKNAVNNKETIYISGFQNSDLHYDEFPSQEKLGVPVKANEGKKIGCLVRELLQQVSACEVMNSKQTTYKSNAAASSDASSDPGPPVLYCYLSSDVVPVLNKGECSTNGIRQNKNTNRNTEKSLASTKPPCGRTTQTDKQDLNYNKNIQRNGGLSWWINGQDFHHNNSSKTERIYRNVLPPPTAVSKSKPACFNNNNKQDNCWFDLNQVLKATRKGKASPFPTKKNVPAPQQPKKKPFLL